MVAANTARVLELLGVTEGGYVNHPKDPGGPTNRGVTQRVYTAWLRSKGRRPQSVKVITQAEADTIFVEQYFAPVWFDRLPGGLDYAMADFSVNSGPYRAVKYLQKTLNLLRADYPEIPAVDADGAMGLLTLEAVFAAPIMPLIGELMEQRLRFMMGLKQWEAFKKGWSRRIRSVKRIALSMAVQGQDYTSELPIIVNAAEKNALETTTIEGKAAGRRKNWFELFIDWLIAAFKEDSVWTPPAKRTNEK